MLIISCQGCCCGSLSPGTRDGAPGIPSLCEKCFIAGLHHGFSCQKFPHPWEHQTEHFMNHQNPNLPLFPWAAEGREDQTLLGWRGSISCLIPSICSCSTCRTCFKSTNIFKAPARSLLLPHNWFSASNQRFYPLPPPKICRAQSQVVCHLCKNVTHY